VNALVYTAGVLVFAFGVLASIALHEVGHLYPAKKFGVKVTQYFVGFGKTLWSVKRGETEYGLKAFPLGGFVKLVGMLPPAKDDADGKVRSSNTGLFTQLVTDARTAEYEHVQPGDENRLFYRKPWWQKLIVMAGGPLVNVAIAVVLFTVLLVGIGALTPTLTVASVSDCVIPTTEQRTVCRPGDQVAPAREAGLRPGDVITSFNGTEVSSWNDLTALIRSNADGDAEIGIVRDGDAQTLQADTTVTARPDLDNPTQNVEVGFLGVGPTSTYVRQDLGTVAEVMSAYTKATVDGILHLPQRMVGVVDAAFGGERRADSPMSVVGASRVAGDMVTAEETSALDDAYGLMTLLATVNLFIALFNFIPLLPLDGGHIAGALWEGLRRGFARVTRRPDPGHVDVAKMLPVAYAVAGLLMIMGVLLIYADIVNPVRIY
jgi:membrane-associated protease RseP (regulator of RpoE activity)